MINQQINVIFYSSLQLLSRSGLFISANKGEVVVWLDHLMSCESSQTDQIIAFFVSCVDALHQNSSEFVHFVLNSMSDAQTFKNTLFGDQRVSVDTSLVAFEGIYLEIHIFGIYWSTFDTLFSLIASVLGDCSL